MTGRGVERCGVLAFAVAEPLLHILKSVPCYTAHLFGKTSFLVCCFISIPFRLHFCFHMSFFINSNPQAVGDVTFSRISVKRREKRQTMQIFGQVFISSKCGRAETQLEYAGNSPLGWVSSCREFSLIYYPTFCILVHLYLTLQIINSW